MKHFCIVSNNLEPKFKPHDHITNNYMSADISALIVFKSQFQHTFDALQDATTKDTTFPNKGG